MAVDRRFLANLRLLGMVEGVSTLVLFGVAMPLKYLAGMPLAVTVAGTLHGMLFIALALAFLAGIKKIPISKALAAAGILGAVVPFGPFIVDLRLARIAGARASGTSEV